MQKTQHKKSIIKKVIQIGSSTLASRFLGIIREILTTRYLTPGAASDAFISAFKIPNSLRKIFAEGAISGAFIPSLVRILKYQDLHEANKFMTLLMVTVQSIVLAICLTLTFNAEIFLRYTVPGFDQEQLFYAIPLLRILVFFILPISFAAILGGALQAVHKFFIPASAPIVYNIAFILSVCACIYFQLPIYFFAYFILGSGLLFAVMHLVAYKKNGFGFALFDRGSCIYLLEVLFKFLPVIFTVGVVEFNSYIDSYLASGLETGTVTLLYYAHRFSQIPLGVFGAAFSTIFLPYFSHIGTYAPRRLGFFIHEALKLIMYITVPVGGLLMFFSYDVFNTLFNFSGSQTVHVGQLLAIASCAIFFQSANKTLISLFYSLNNTVIPTIISLFATGIHIILNITLIDSLQAKGLLLAGVIASIVQTILYICALQIYLKYPLYLNHLFRFLRGMTLQCLLFGLCFYQSYFLILALLKRSSTPLEHFFTQSIGLWLWVGPLAVGIALGMFFSRKKFGIKLYFLD